MGRGKTGTNGAKNKEAIKKTPEKRRKTKTKTKQNKKKKLTKIPNALSQHLIFPIQHGSFSLIEGSFIPTAPSGPEFTTNTTSTSNIRSMQIIGLTGPSGRSMARQGGSSASRRGKWRDYRKRRRAKIGLWSGTGLIDDGGSGR